MNRNLIIAAATLVLALALGACAAPSETSSTTQSTEPAVIAPGCTRADPIDAAAITAGLQSGHTLGEAFVAAIGARRWVNANVYDATGRRASSADVWIIEPTGVYAISGSASKLSTFADGRRLPDRPSAGDDIAYRLQTDCVIPATAQRP